jgi:hypothetical protein
MSKRRPVKRKPEITRKDFSRLSVSAYVSRIKAMQVNGYEVETIASALGLTVEQISILLRTDSPKVKAMRQRNA